MTIGINAIRSKRQRFLYILVEAWRRQHTDFLVTEKDESYIIQHPELPTGNHEFEVPQSDINAMIKTGYLAIEPREEPKAWTLRIHYQGFDVFDGQLRERALPEYERRVVFDIEGNQGETEERTVPIQGHLYTLAAMPSQDNGDWMARVIRYSLTVDAQSFREPILDPRSELHDQAAILRTMRATGSTPEAALTSLEVKLRSSIEPTLASDTSRRSTG